VTEQSGHLATQIVRRYRDKFGRGPTEARAIIGDDFALVILGSAQTEVERCAITEEVTGKKVKAMLGDHNAVANTTVLVFLLESPDAE
jgi:uncharacterized protein YbcI